MVLPLIESVGTTTVSVADSDTSYTFPSVSFGTDHSSTEVIVIGVLQKVGGTNISSVTIDGNAATEIQNDATGTSGDRVGAYLGQYAPPGGFASSGDIVVTLVGSAIGSDLSSLLVIWRLYNLRSTTVEDSAVNTTTPIDVNLTGISSGAVGVGITISDNNGTIAWTGLDEEFDVAIDTIGGRRGGASRANLSSGGQTISATTPSGAAIGIAAAWR